MKSSQEYKLMPWTLNFTGLSILVPKIRGDGYLKTPVYHGNNELSFFVSDELQSDCSGLEGCLDIGVGDQWSAEGKQFINKAVSLISKHLNAKPVRIYHGDMMEFLMGDISEEEMLNTT